MSKKQVVRVFSKPGCGPCEAVKKFLDNSSIPYEQATQEDAAGRGYRSVPITEVWTDENTMIRSFPGWDMKELLELKGDYFGTI